MGFFSGESNAFQSKSGKIFLMELRLRKLLGRLSKPAVELRLRDGVETVPVYKLLSLTLVDPFMTDSGPPPAEVANKLGEMGAADNVPTPRGFNEFLLSVPVRDGVLGAVPLVPQNHP